MRTVDKYPDPSKFDEAFFDEIQAEWTSGAQRAEEQTRLFDFIKLAYSLGYARAGNTIGWD